MKGVTLEELRQLALGSKDLLWQKARSLNRDVKLYLHWSAGHYGQFFDDYHINIDWDGSLYVSTEDLSAVLAHTWRRNTGSMGIALACCYGATTKELGHEPPTLAQIEAMAQVISVLANVLEIPIDLPHVLTHGEAGDNMDGFDATEKYGMNSTCERWDIAILHTGDVWGSGGDILRGKAIWYQYHS